MLYGRYFFKHYRFICAWVCLTVILTNGVAELGLLLRINPLPTVLALLHTSSSKPPVAHCCCQVPPKVEAGEYRIICTCTCCGDHCPMGAACTCNAPKLRIRVAGLFFKAPSCHPEGADEGGLIPQSLGFVFVVPRPPVATSLPAMYETIAQPTLAEICFFSKPVPPPPKAAAA